MNQMCTFYLLPKTGFWTGAISSQESSVFSSSPSSPLPAPSNHHSLPLDGPGINTSETLKCFQKEESAFLSLKCWAVGKNSGNTHSK